jgi:hypothetical protein
MSVVEAGTLEQLKVGVSPRLVIVQSDPQLLWTRRGYAPVLEVEDVHKGGRYLLYISAFSLAEPLEARRGQRGSLVGSALSLKKQSADPMSKYEVSFED